MSDETPWAFTEPHLLGVLEELRRREPIFHRPELGMTRADFDAQTVPDYWEVGASGRRYSREVIWSTLEKRYAAGEPDEWETSGFHCRHLAGETYLLTSTLRQGDRVTHRASIWQRTDDGWRILYHQGTVVS